MSFLKIQQNNKNKTNKTKYKKNNEIIFIGDFQF